MKLSLLENSKRIERSEAVERFELSETLERNNLLLTIAYSLMPALIKRLERTPDSIRGTNLGVQRKEKELRLYQGTMDNPTLLKMREG